MPRIHERKELLLPEKTERCSLAKPRRCLRTECVISAVVLGLLAMFVTWGSSSIVKAGYELVQTRACLTKAEKQNELLRMEMARVEIAATDSGNRGQPVGDDQTAGGVYRSQRD